VFGCKPLTPGCLNCYAARCAGTLQTATDIALYVGTTDLKAGRYTFNGELRVLPPGHPSWTFPRDWKGAANPVLGPGKPSLLWISDMSELFLPGRPMAVIDRTLGMVAISDHIGLVLTKCPNRLAAYFHNQPRWRSKFWLGFSAERQIEFDQRWPALRTLAKRGWPIFVSIAPMLGLVTFPRDFLDLCIWVICSGEQGPSAHVRYMQPNWARRVRDQCVAAGVPFFLKQMTGKKPIPPDLVMYQQFPKV